MVSGFTSSWWAATALTTIGVSPWRLMKSAPMRGVASLQLARDGLADVVEEAGALGQVRDRARSRSRSARRGTPSRPSGRARSGCRRSGTCSLPRSLMISEWRPLMLSLLTASSPACVVDEVDLVLRPLDELLDARRVDAAVLDQGLERDRARSRGAPGRRRRGAPAAGDSSIRSVTPVAASNDLMLRPSRPMSRPFISSLGRWTRVAVRSVFGLLASRCIEAIRIRRDWVCSSCSDFSSVSRRRARSSSWHSSRTSSRSCLLTSSRVQLRDALEALAHVLREVADRVARLPDRGSSPGSAAPGAAPAGSRGAPATPRGP